MDQDLETVLLQLSEKKMEILLKIERYNRALEINLPHYDSLNRDILAELDGLHYELYTLNEQTSIAIQTANAHETNNPE